MHVKNLPLRLIWGVVIGMMFLCAPAFAFALELVMVQQPGCVWCERWNREIGVLYHNTTEGRLAPLTRIDLRETKTSSYTFTGNIAFTPTFVLVDDNKKEISRLTGYPGEDFFWPLLDNMLVKAGHDAALF